MKTLRNLLLAFTLVALASCAAPAPQADGARVVGTGVFVSAAGETMRAVYRADDTVTLTLPDGSTELLPIAVSGSGARYAAGNREWWEHQGEATYSVDGKPVFSGKLQR
ncbi:MAG: MliC family protein [Xanthomonadales bacterium]|nr:MliC family protein [Xanthomonadales bacterium]